MRFFVILALAVLASGDAFALSCEKNPDPIYDYEAIFYGEAVSTQKVPEEDKVKTDTYKTPPRVTRFKVIEKYKGPISDFVDVYHNDTDRVTSYIKGKPVPASIPGISINFKMGDKRYLFLNKGYIDEYVWAPCSGSAYNVTDWLPLEKYRVVSELYERMLSATKTPHEYLDFPFVTPNSKRGVFTSKGDFHGEYNAFPEAFHAYRSAIFFPDTVTSHAPITLDEMDNIDIGGQYLKLAIGKLYYKQENYDLALEIFKQVVETYEKEEERLAAIEPLPVKGKGTRLNVPQSRHLKPEQKAVFNDAKKYRALTLEAMEQDK